MLKIRKISTGIWLAIIIAVCDVYMVMFKLHYGIAHDEIFAIAQAECFTRDISFFKDSWSAYQFGAVIIAPLSYLFKIITGSTDGILYFFRIIWLVMQNILTFAAYNILKKIELPIKDAEYAVVPNRLAICIAICLYFYFPFYCSVNYKTLAYWNCTFIILLLTDMYRKQTVFKAVLLGVALSLSTLSYEYTAIMIVPIVIGLVYVSKKAAVKPYKYVITVIVTCVVCAGFFIGYAISQIGFADFIVYFPKFLGFEGYDENPIIKVGRHLLFYIFAFALNFCFILFYEKKLKEKISLGKLLTAYLLLAIAVVMLAKPQTITISRVNYIMGLMYTLCIVLIARYMKRSQRKLYTYLFILPIGFYVLCVSLATNQGVAVSSMGCILATIPLFFLASETQLNLGGGVVRVVTVMMVFAGLILVPCAYTSNLTIFHSTVEMSYGPAKGLRMDTCAYEDIIQWQEMVNKYVAEDDKPLMLGNNCDPISYLYSKVSKFGTYSPGCMFANSTRLIDFWSMNTDRQPTVAIVKLTDLGYSLDKFLSETPVGVWLNDYFDNWETDGDYAIGR